jgi:ADP-heptose:LPS heptosyltransferase
VLLTTPLIDAAKRRWPAAQIDVLGFAGTLAILRGNPQIGALIEVPAGSGWLQSLALIRASGAATTWRWSRSTATARICTARSPRGRAAG